RRPFALAPRTSDTECQGQQRLRRCWLGDIEFRRLGSSEVIHIEVREGLDVSNKRLNPTWRRLFATSLRGPSIKWAVKTVAVTISIFLSPITSSLSRTTAVFTQVKHQWNLNVQL